MPAASENIDCQNNSKTEFEEDNHLISTMDTRHVETHKVIPSTGALL